MIKYFAMFLVFFLVSCSEEDKTLTNELLIDQGSLQGYEDENANYYLGIPYAKAPVGDLRWKPPLKHEGWKEKLLATDVPSSCMQPTGFGLGPFIGLWVDGSGMNWFKRKLLYFGAGLMPFLDNGEDGNSEDCLYLNIVTPKISNQKLPVMMWIHGGGYRFGNGAGAYIDSDLVSKDVILVSINYRLGSLGYFAHPTLSAESDFNSSGNYGTLDQIQALKWIKENIGEFGGDQNNITIFGESAGGHAVRQLMSSPLSEGLFHKAIAQSSYAIGNTLHLKKDSGTIQSAERSGKDFVKTLGLNEDDNLLQNLRNIPAKDLLQVGAGMVNPEDASNEEDYVISAAWMPNVDNWVFKDSALNISKTKQTHNVPFLLGFNSFEGSSLLPMFYTNEQHKKDTDWIKTIWELAIPNDPNNIADGYKEWAKGIEKESYLASQKLWGDVQFGASTYFTALNHSKVNPNTYFYYFNRSPISKKQIIGATHAVEVMYLFNAFIPGWPKNDVDDKIGDQMRTDWTDFAKTGDLSKKGWSKFSENNQIQKNYDENLDHSALVELDLFKAMYKYLNDNQD